MPRIIKEHTRRTQSGRTRVKQHTRKSTSRQNYILKLEKIFQLPLGSKQQHHAVLQILKDKQIVIFGTNCTGKSFLRRQIYTKHILKPGQSSWEVEDEAADWDAPIIHVNHLIPKYRERLLSDTNFVFIFLRRPKNEIKNCYMSDYSGFVYDDVKYKIRKDPGNKFRYLEQALNKRLGDASYWDEQFEQLARSLIRRKRPIVVVLNKDNHFRTISINTSF